MAVQQITKNIKLEWNSKAIIDLIKQMASAEEDGASRRIMHHAVRTAPIGKYGQYRYPKSRAPLHRRKKYNRSGFKKSWQFRRPGSLMHSIKKYESKFKEGGKTVFAGNERLVYYAHFVEFGTVYMEKRRGYRFMRNAINRERRLFSKKLQANLAGDMNG